MNNKHHKKYPPRRYRQHYTIPQEPHPRKAIEQQKQKSGEVKAFVIGFILIIIILGIFFWKKDFQYKQEFAKQKNQEEWQMDKIELDIVYISPKDVSRNTNNKNFQLVDIREANEFKLKHIESSINIPLSQIKEKIGIISKTKEIVIIDKENSQIGKVFADHLKNEGANVKYLEGGIMGYSQKGYSLVTKGNPTLTEDLLKVDSISAEEIKNKIKNGQFFVFIDVRPKMKYASDNIEGSVNIPLEEIEKRRKSIPFGTLLVYDSDAIRSFQAAVRLRDMQIINVYNSLDEYATLKKVLLDATRQSEQPSKQPEQNEQPKE